MSKKDGHGYYTKNEQTGVEYQQWIGDMGETHVIGTTPDGEQFHQHFPGGGSQYGTDSKGNDWDVPSKR